MQPGKVKLELTADDALVASTAELYQSDRKRHDNEARAFTKKVFYSTLFYL